MPSSFLREKFFTRLNVEFSSCTVLLTMAVMVLVAQPSFAASGALAKPGVTDEPSVVMLQAVKHRPITVTAHLGNATQGKPFSGSITAVGGIAPYHFSIRGGALPSGLSLNGSTGVISGTPKNVGETDFTVRVAGLHWINLTDMGLQMTVSPEATHITVTVTPGTATVASGTSQQLTGVVHGSENQQIRWNATAGTVTPTGLFTAPSAVEKTMDAIVTATSVADTKATAQSTIVITPKTGITVSVSPASATVASGAAQQLTATVHGSTNTQVRWSTTAGTVSTSGLFTAPTVTNSTTAMVTATSAASSSASATATISVSAGSSTTLSISSSNLPGATKGSSYYAGLSATGGSQPYKWSMTTGSLPAGVTFSATGLLSGTPSATGSFSFTAKVTDSASHTASATLALVVSAVSTNGTFDGPAELPRVYIQSAMANSPATGKTWPVSDTAGLQAALNGSACGDTISIKAGATLSGTWAFPGKSCDNQHWIIVRTSAPDSSLPAEGTRITPCFAGVASLPGRPALNCTSTQNVMAKLVFGLAAGSGPIIFLSGANHYRLIGLEVTRNANGTAVGNLSLANQGATGDHIIFDRVWMHGTAHDDTTRGIYLSGLTNVAVVDSYLNDFHCESNIGTCTDAQTIVGGLGSFPGGPYKIVNNFLESSGENILFGGGGAAYSPADIEISHNHFFKPFTWMVGQPNVVLGNHGKPFIVKNHFELKNAQRVLFEGNIAENSWGGFSQAGFTVLLTAKNTGAAPGGCPLCQVTDVTIRNSRFSHIGGGFQIANALADQGSAPFAGGRFSIHDVILDDMDDVAYGGQGQLAQLSTGNNSPLLGEVLFNHITAFPAHMLFDISGGTSPKMPNLTFTNSIVTTGLNAVTTAGGGNNSCSFSHGAASTVLSNCFASFSFGSNVLAAVPSRFPASTWPAGNTMTADGNSVGFVNFNHGNGGDYHLKSSSTFKAASSDGKDMGADVDAIAAATAGAY